MHRHNLRCLHVMASSLLALALAGCLGAGQDRPQTDAPPAPAIHLSGLCLEVKQYSPAELAALADAVEHLPAKSPIIPAMGDYKRMRDESRACQAAAK